MCRVMSRYQVRGWNIRRDNLINEDRICNNLLQEKEELMLTIATELALTGVAAMVASSVATPPVDTV